jgi:hypothetical protein
VETIPFVFKNRSNYFNEKAGILLNDEAPVVQPGEVQVIGRKYFYLANPDNARLPGNSPFLRCVLQKNFRRIA